MKKWWVLLAAGLLLACVCPATPLVSTTQPPDDPVIAGNLTVTRLYPGDGDLTAQLQAEAPKAAALGQHMFVEFDASW